jgi:hypothetical protein
MNSQAQYIFTSTDKVDLTISYTTGVVVIEFRIDEEIQLVVGMDAPLSIKLLTELREALEDLHKE